MRAEEFLQILEDMGADFFAGVPDSLLSPLCDRIQQTYPASRHVVTANEGAAAALAAGHYLATGKIGAVYLQNSGLGNLVNPHCSLLHPAVYAVPAVYVVGWRGEPGVKDEPQHVFQGVCTEDQLKVLEIDYFVISKDTDAAEVRAVAERFKEKLKEGRQVAFLVRKGAVRGEKTVYANNREMTREEIVRIAAEAGDERDVFVCTTGKLSREMFELREALGQDHGRDFLTVGSMGHSLMIALGVAEARPDRTVWCLDGDGAVLMHMGSLAVVGARKPKNLIHLAVNNGAHETVGGIPTVGENLDFSQIALACGYRHVHRAETPAELRSVLETARRQEGPVFVEASANLKSREDLGRPTTTPVQNKEALMRFLSVDAGKER